MTNLINFETLAGIGLSAAMQAQLVCGVADPVARPMRLVQVQRQHLLLHDGLYPHRGHASAELLRDLQRQDEALVVDDWVLARPQDGGGWLVNCRLLPERQITRRLARRNSLRDLDGQADIPRQALVSNVDTALLVMGLDADFNLRRLERYLALAQLAGVAAVLVLSKADTVLPALQAQRLAQARAVLPAGMAALALDLRQPAAAEHLAPWLLRGQTLVLLGSSGAGKTTLANTLVHARPQALPPLPTPSPLDVAAPDPNPIPRQTGPVRSADSRGRHTTTVRSLLPLPAGACLIDTPGLRALRLDLADASSLAEAFGDVARWAPLCRFRDCQHRQEPGCAVREQLPQARLHNFHKLLREAGRDGLSLPERRAELVRWKARSRNAALRLRAKREAGA
jgi:ribosome biogenesis GTPase